MQATFGHKKGEKVVTLIFFQIELRTLSLCKPKDKVSVLQRQIGYNSIRTSYIHSKAQVLKHS